MTFLERLADVIDGDELRSIHFPHVRGAVLGTHVLVRQRDEDTLDERDDRRTAPVVRDVKAEVRPRRR